MTWRAQIRAAVSVVVIGLACAAAVGQATASADGQGPFKVMLSDVTAAIDAVAGAEKAAAGQPGLLARLQAVDKALRQARAAASGPDKDMPVPGNFASGPAAGPYVQYVAPDRVLIRWAAIGSGTTVRYGAGGKLTSTAEAVRLPWPRWMHEAELKGLASGTEYVYSVPIGGHDVTGRFRTSPAGDGAFSFAVWGDSQCYPDVFAGVTKQMARHPIDLAICTGDAVEEGQTDGDYYRQLFDPARDVLRNAFLFSAVGNHETYGDPDLTRRKRLLHNPDPGKSYFAFTYANCRFIVLDSNEKSLYGGDQLDWLKRELASEACVRARFRFMFLHHAPFCWDWYGGEAKVQQTIAPLAEKAKVDVIFAGHFHCYERGARPADGHQTWYVVNGGGAGFFTDRNGPGRHERDWMTKHEWKHHFVLADVDAGGLKVQAVDDKGEVFDTFEIKRSAAGEVAPAPARTATQTPPAPAKVGLATDDTRWCTINANDRRAALTALAECDKALADTDAQTAGRLDRVAAMLEEARDLSREGAWTGPVERTAHLVPRLVNGGIHFRLKPSEEADASVREVLDKIGYAKDPKVLGKQFHVKGLDTPMLPQRWILVDSIVQR